MPVSEKTAFDIAMAYREVTAAEELLVKVNEEMAKAEPDIRDAFGRRKGLQLGVPSGSSSHRLLDVPWSMARPIIEAQIARKRQQIAELSTAAKIEAETQ